MWPEHNGRVNLDLMYYATRTDPVPAVVHTHSAKLKQTRGGIFMSSSAPGRFVDLYHQDVPFYVSLGSKTGKPPAPAHGPILENDIFAEPASLTYGRSCFRPLCLPWCRPAASGGRSRVGSRAVWRCPSAGALQTKHPRQTLANTHTHSHTVVKWHLSRHMSACERAHTLSQRSEYLLSGIFKQKSARASVRKTSAFRQTDRTLVLLLKSAKTGLRREGFNVFSCI